MGDATMAAYISVVFWKKMSWFVPAPHFCHHDNHRQLCFSPNHWNNIQFSSRVLLSKPLPLWQPGWAYVIIDEISLNNPWGSDLLCVWKKNLQQGLSGKEYPGHLSPQSDWPFNLLPLSLSNRERKERNEDIMLPESLSKEPPNTDNHGYNWLLGSHYTLPDSDRPF